MSKMQNAFEKWIKTQPSHLTQRSIAFETGWLAAIAAIKEHGPSMEIIDYHDYLLHTFPKGDYGLRLDDKLYKLPKGNITNQLDAIIADLQQGIKFTNRLATILLIIAVIIYFLPPY